MDPEALLREALGSKFQGLSLADRDKLIKLVLGVAQASQAPVQQSMDRMAGLLEQLVARGASPQVVERVVLAATSGAQLPVEVTPELIGRLLEAADMKTNIDDAKVEAGKSESVDDAVARLRKLQGGK